MKRVANWFEWGLGMGIVYLSLSLIQFMFWLYGRTDAGFVHDSHLPLLFLDLGVSFSRLFTEFLFTMSAVFYLWDKVSEYNEAEEKTKLNHEPKTETNVTDIQHKRTVSDIY